MTDKESALCHLKMMAHLVILSLLQATAKKLKTFIVLSGAH